MAGHARPLAALARKPLVQHWLRTSHEIVDTKRLRNAVRAEQATTLTSSLGYDAYFHNSQKPTGDRNIGILSKNRPSA